MLWVLLVVAPMVDCSRQKRIEVFWSETTDKGTFDLPVVYVTYNFFKEVSPLLTCKVCTCRTYKYRATYVLLSFERH